jgi:transcriptional regulator with XRE-family HTH domain
VSAFLLELALGTMEFPERLARLRKERSLTQQALADQVGIHVLQIRRHEGGTSQPTLDVLRRLAIALSVSADELVFNAIERDPEEELRLRFEAVQQFDADDRSTILALIDGMILKHQAKQVIRSAATKPAPPRAGAIKKKKPTGRERARA